MIGSFAGPRARCLVFGIVFVAIFCTSANSIRADVALASIFSDHVVLQRDREIPVWGTAADDEEVTVQLGEQKVTTKPADGRWMVRLSPMPAGGPFTLTATGKNSVVVNDVLIGEVWVCSGQSNMAWPLAQTFESESVIADANDPQLHLLTIPRVAIDTPQTSFDAKWAPCTPETAKDFSGVAYFFGTHLRAKLGVPVGLINTSFGGTPAEAWTSAEKLNAHPRLAAIVEEHKKAIAAFPEAQAAHEAAVAKWKEESEKAKAEGKQPPPAPRAPVNPEANPQRPSGLYNAMIAPIVPFAIEGAIWYQGESNAGRAAEYGTLFPAMIEDWRERWGQGDFPFLFVQLAPFTRITPEPGESDWAELREAQRMTTIEVRETGMAVITDLGEELDIHPRKKREVGDRLALAARKMAYGEDIVASGPTIDSIQVQGNKAVLNFDNLGGGLVAKDGALTGFTIAGADHKFYKANAEIVGDTVVVTAPEVPHPVAVRFGWANFPVVNLWNKAGLPASPFRTDDFPLSTGPK